MSRARRCFALFVVVALVTALAVPATGIAVSSGRASVIEAQAIFAPDEYEPSNDVTATAPLLPMISYHTLHDGGDDDWSKFVVDEADTPYIIEARRLEGHTSEPDMGIYKMESDGSMTELAWDGDYNTNWGTYDETIYWEAPAPGTYYILVTNGQWDTGGCVYELSRTKGIARRIAGTNRYETAVAVSQTMRRETDNPWWGTGYSPQKVFLASGENFPDALAGVVLASYYDSVLLLTRPDSLPWSTYLEIERLGISNFWNSDDFEVVILGGENAVSADIEDEIAQIRSVSHVSRIAGDNRHETAALIAKAADDYHGVNNTAYVVSGRTFPDALGAGPVAAYGGSVLLTTEPNRLPQATADALVDLNIADVILVGGESAISTAVAEAIEDVPGVVNVDRLEGSNRYETARVVAQYGVDNFGMDGNAANVDYGYWYGMGPVVVSGTNFPDALAAGVMCWYKGSPLLLTRPDRLSSSVETFLDANGPTTEPSYVVGGPAAVAGPVFDAFTNYYKNW